MAVESSSTPVAAYAYNGLGHRVYEDDLVPDTRRELIYSPGWQLLEERLWWDFEDDGDYDQLSLIAQNIWGQRYIDDLIGRRVQHGYDDSGWVEPDGSWDHEHLSLILTDSMFSVRQIIGDDWGSTSFSKWMRERAQLEIDYTSYGIPNAIVGLATDPWVDFDGDGDVDASDYSTFYSTHYAANDPEADRDADSDWDYFDVQFFLADTSAAGATLTPTGREDEEENPFGLAGYRHDAITGLYHVRNRVLDPQQGRWLQRDPAGFVDGENIYQYADGSPILAKDPMGLWKVERHSGSMLATATSEDDPLDNIRALGIALGLDPVDFRKWMAGGHPDPVKTPQGNTAFADITIFDSLCPDQGFSIPNTIFWVDTAPSYTWDLRIPGVKVGLRSHHRSEARKHGYHISRLTGDYKSSDQVLAIWDKLGTDGKLFGVYLDVHSDGLGWYTAKDMWYNSNPNEGDKVYFDRMIDKTTYRLSLLYGALCNSNVCNMTYGSYGFSDLGASGYLRSIWSYGPGTFIPKIHDNWGIITNEWGDPSSLDGR